jgi:hypothetical protein
MPGEEGEDYELYLYGSHDNFTTPLQMTTGDVGKKIIPGKDKVIYWDAKSELGNFKGDFSLRVKGAVYIPFVKFTSIPYNFSIKRGQIFEVNWDPTDKTKEVLFKIQRYGVPINDALVVENKGKFVWEIPKNVKPGKGYSIQILDTQNPLREETSNTFVIKRKIPTAYKIVPLALLGGAATFLLTKDPSTGIPPPPGLPEH